MKRPRVEHDAAARDPSRSATTRAKSLLGFAASRNAAVRLARQRRARAPTTSRISSRAIGSTLRSKRALEQAQRSQRASRRRRCASGAVRLRRHRGPARAAALRLRELLEEPGRAGRSPRRPRRRSAAPKRLIKGGWLTAVLARIGGRCPARGHPSPIVNASGRAQKPQEALPARAADGRSRESTVRPRLSATRACCLPVRPAARSPRRVRAARIIAPSGVGSVGTSAAVGRVAVGEARRRARGSRARGGRRLRRPRRRGHRGASRRDGRLLRAEHQLAQRAGRLQAGAAFKATAERSRT